MSYPNGQVDREEGDPDRISQEQDEEKVERRENNCKMQKSRRIGV